MGRQAPNVHVRVWKNRSPMGIRRTVRRETRFVRRALHHPRLVLLRARRLTSARTLYVERNHDIENAMMLVSSGRSGSTWLSEVLVDAFSSRLIFEPFRRDRVPLSADLPWGSYAQPGTDRPELERVVGRILSGRIRHPLVDSLNQQRFPRRRLVKEIRANNLLPWMHTRFPRVPYVYLLRHPVAASWSATQLRWKPFLDEFIRQDKLITGPLAPYTGVIARHGDDPDLFHRHVLRWCLENVVPVQLLAPGSVHVVFYEDLLEEPDRELSRLARYFERFGPRWPFDPSTPRAMNRPSRANYRRTPALTGDQRLASWVEVVPAPSVSRAVALLAEFGLDRLYGSSVRPQLAADEVLRGSPVGQSERSDGGGRTSSKAR